MAQRIIQFPVRNAFAAQRSRDSLARDPQESDPQTQAHRIAQQVENEVARQAERLASGRSAQFAATRSKGVVMMRKTSRSTRLRKNVASMQAQARSFTAKLFTRR